MLYYTCVQNDGNPDCSFVLGRKRCGILLVIQGLERIAEKAHRYPEESTFRVKNA